jgi:hypothetical protein
MNSDVLPTLHEKRKIKIYSITKKEQLKSEMATDCTLLWMWKQEILSNMDMLRRCGKVLKQNEQNTIEATLYIYKCSLPCQHGMYFNELGFMSAFQV